MTADATPPRKGRGGRPKGDPSAVCAIRYIRAGCRRQAALFVPWDAVAELIGPLGELVSPQEREALVERLIERGTLPPQARGWCAEVDADGCWIVDPNTEDDPDVPWFPPDFPF